MPKDGLVKLPASVAASMLQAITSIQSALDTRLVLQRPDINRRPGQDRRYDYNVLWRGQTIGRVWRYDYTQQELPVWHWRWNDVAGKPNRKGHAPTLEAAIADFRRAWDKSAKSGAA
jgi:hypothetical protein